MIFYKAREQDTAPFLVFDLVAETIEELQDKNLEGNPLVVAEDDLPSYEGSICHSKIQNGQLVARQQAQIDAFILEATEQKTIALNAQKKDAVDIASFEYSGVTYPMDAASQLRYLAIFQTGQVDRQIQTKGAVVTLQADDITRFKEAYYTAVLNTTEPT